MGDEGESVSLLVNRALSAKRSGRCVLSASTVSCSQVGGGWRCLGFLSVKKLKDTLETRSVLSELVSSSFILCSRWMVEKSGKDVLGRAVEVSVKAKLGAKGVGDSWDADSLGGDGDEGCIEDRVTFISANSAVKDSGGQPLQHTVSNVVGAGERKSDR